MQKNIYVTCIKLHSSQIKRRVTIVLISDRRPHFGNGVPQSLNARCPNKWLGKEDQITWTIRLPNYSRVDLCLWDYVSIWEAANS
jgi:hypothetical protein